MMSAIHCRSCGGVISGPATIEYRPPRASAQLALSQPDLCACTPPIVSEDPPVIEAPKDEAGPSG